jgi:hypothetical protein
MGAHSLNIELQAELNPAGDHTGFFNAAGSMGIFLSRLPV